MSLRTASRVSIRSTALMFGTGVLMQSARAHAWFGAKGFCAYDRQWWLRTWARMMLLSSATRVSVVGSITRNQRPRLIVANHRTPLDIPLLMSLFGGRVLSKSDVADLPVVGSAATWAETIYVDRDDRTSGAGAIREIRKALKAGGTVSVFPEGTTHAGDEVRPFRSGAFAALRAMDVEVIPVGIAYDPGVEFVNETFSAHLSRIAQRASTSVCVRVGSALAGSALNGFGSSSSISYAARQAVQELVLSARKDWHAATPHRSSFMLNGQRTRRVD